MNPMEPLPHHADQKRKFWGKMIWISAMSFVFSICAFNFAIPTGVEGTIVTMNHDPLQPGDLAVTEDRRHDLIFLWGEDWIQADPGAEKS